ncbi:hypothetical protein [Planctopirus hydrillae]|nr:hypothetical protein [Planctopirus hydrillae]
MKERRQKGEKPEGEKSEEEKSEVRLANAGGQPKAALYRSLS